MFNLFKRKNKEAQVRPDYGDNYIASLTPDERDAYFASLPAEMEEFLQQQDQEYAEKAEKESDDFRERVFSLANSSYAGNIHHE